MDTINIYGKECTIFINKAENKPIEKCIYLGSAFPERENLEQTLNFLKNNINDKSYIIVAYEVENWNKDFSPWEAPPVFGLQKFDGGGEETLNWLENKCIPFIEKKYLDNEPVHNLLAGYSLAGLFSLWAFYSSDKFLGFASLSGSLWFPNLLDFIKNKSAKNNSVAYLSIGDKEENTKNEIVSKVGHITREIDILLSNDKNIRKNILEINNGGHFNDIVNRINKGITWLLM